MMLIPTGWLYIIVDCCLLSCYWIDDKYSCQVNNVFQLILVVGALLQPELGTPKTRAYIIYLRYIGKRVLSLVPFGWHELLRRADLLRFGAADWWLLQRWILLQHMECNTWGIQPSLLHGVIEVGNSLLHWLVYEWLHLMETLFTMLRRSAHQRISLSS